MVKFLFCSKMTTLLTVELRFGAFFLDSQNLTMVKFWVNCWFFSQPRAERSKTEQDTSKTRRARTSCPLSKALITPCRDEISKRIIPRLRCPNAKQTALCVRKPEGAYLCVRDRGLPQRNAVLRSGFSVLQ